MKEKNEIVYDVDGKCYIEIISRIHGLLLCQIDEEDIELVQMYRWHIKKDVSRANGRQLEVKTHSYDNTKANKRIHLYLHRHLMANKIAANPHLPQIDHIDSDPTNNTRTNLRLCTNQQNQFFRTDAKGYYKDHKSNKWRAEIAVKRVKKHLGLFKTEEEAHAAYLAAKEKYHKIEDHSSK